MAFRVVLLAALGLAACAGAPDGERGGTADTGSAACRTRWEERPTSASFQVIEVADARRFIADYNRLMQARLSADRAVVLRSRAVKRAALVAFLAGDCVERLLYLDPALLRILEGDADT